VFRQDRSVSQARVTSPEPGDVGALPTRLFAVLVGGVERLDEGRVSAANPARADGRLARPVVLDGGRSGNLRPWLITSASVLSWGFHMLLPEL
jgi:hypothetical protein